MSPLRVLQRPEYFFNPGQIIRRLQRQKRLRQDTVELAWGLPIRTHPRCFTGLDMVNLGVYDRIVPEAICRLLDTGEHAVDVGANIGQNTALMALMAGHAGDVIAFEPHPVLVETLSHNIEQWKSYSLAPIAWHTLALSDHFGSATLYEPAGFVENYGLASLEQPEAFGETHTIALTTLDLMVPEHRIIHVLKLDVEGHEAALLRGSARLLAAGQIRDIIFECFDPKGQDTIPLLQRAGYTVFALQQRWHRPLLVPLGQHLNNSVPSLFSDNFVATLAPERARERFAAWGWQCLRRRARKR